MKKFRSIFFLLIALLPQIALADDSKIKDCANSVQPFLSEYFDSLNYCQNDKDCKITASSSFSCTGGFVNKENYDERIKLEELYQKKYGVGCDKAYTPSATSCVENKCVLKGI